MTADAFIMMWSGLSCMALSVALMVDSRQHKHLPRRQWAGFEVVTVSWFFLGLLAFAKSADMSASLDLPFAFGLMVASLGLGLWGVKGRAHDERLQRRGG